MRNSRFKLLLIRLGLIAATALAVGAASAAPIPSWDYTVSSQFIAPTTFTSGGGCTSVGSASITWGGCPSGPPGSGRSGIGITASPQSGTLLTNGAAQPANTYTHTNNVVADGNATLRTATIQATLGLRATGSGLPFTFFSADYTVLFAETPNQTPCAAASPPNNPCNDIWVLQGSLNNSFTFGGDEYFFSFFAAPALASLPSGVCTAAGAAPGCIGFTTVEGQPNAVGFMMALTSEPISVPEPSSLALLGIGLLGFVALRRRSTR